MKKFLYALIFVLTIIVLPSCNENNQEDNTPAEELLIGTWKLQSYSFTYKENGKKVASGTYIATDDFYNILSFRMDGSFTEFVMEKYWNEERTGTWISFSNTLIFNYNSEDDFYITEPTSYTIVSISKTKVTLRESRKYDDDVSSNKKYYEDIYDYTYTKN